MLNHRFAGGRSRGRLRWFAAKGTRRERQGSSSRNRHGWISFSRRETVQRLGNVGLLPRNCRSASSERPKLGDYWLRQGIVHGGRTFGPHLCAEPQNPL
jgi:hypothetical protein